MEFLKRVERNQMIKPTTPKRIIRPGIRKANTLLIYGELFTGKTRQVGRLAKWIYDTTGKTTRYISADGGGFDVLQNLIDAGIIDAISISGREDIQPTLKLLAQGWWYDEDGAMIEPSHAANDISNVGMYVVEGTKFICDQIHQVLLMKSRTFTEKDVITEVEDIQLDTNTKHTFGLPMLRHYEYVQRAITNVIRDFQQLITRLTGNPMLVFTSHTYEVEDDAKRDIRAAAGPAASGKALAKSLPSMFAKTLHLTNNSVRRTIPGTPPKAVVDSEYRAYFLPHRDATSAPYWQATLRFSEEQEARIRAKPEWKELFEQKYLVIPGDDTKGIVRLLEWYEETRKEAGDGAE